MRIGVFGTGPIGLAFGAVLAETGNDVVLVDVDTQRIHAIREGKIPFYEQGLTELVERNIRGERLHFTFQPSKAVQNAQIVFICVGTPIKHNGMTDLRYVFDVSETIAKNARTPLIVAIRSTVPVGTYAQVVALFAKNCAYQVQVAYNPVFAQEGQMVHDFLHPDRVIVGASDEYARVIFADLYEPYLCINNPLLFMEPVSAEVTKLTLNAFLATRISFMNDIARLCDKVGADVNKVRLGSGLDQRIGKTFLFPGIGYGGQRFPRDIRELQRIGQKLGLDMDILKSCEQVNERRKHVIPQRIKTRFGENLKGYTFAIWGLAFKAGTDDISESPALTLCIDLLDVGANLRVYDPQAQVNARKILGDRVMYARNGYDACNGAHALIVAVEWNEFRDPDFSRIKRLLIIPLIFDGRNLYNPEKIAKLGFELVGVGCRTTLDSKLCQ